MKVRDTRGRITSWNLAQCKVSTLDTRPRSDLHLRVRKILHKMFPLEQILEEVPAPGERLYLDFYLPMRKLAVEVHGEQHYKFVPHFHGTKAAFIESRQRDQRKLDWCEINGIKLIVLKYSETDDEWRRAIADY